MRWKRTAIKGGFRQIERHWWRMVPFPPACDLDGRTSGVMVKMLPLCRLPTIGTNAANFREARFWTARRSAEGRSDYVRIADDSSQNLVFHRPGRFSLTHYYVTRSISLYVVRVTDYAGWLSLMKKTQEDLILDDFGRFSEPALLILISLAEGEKHGYSMTEDIAAIAGVKLGAGTLYGALARLEARGLIEPLASHDRRNPYRLTSVGERALRARLAAMQAITRIGQRRLANA